MKKILAFVLIVLMTMTYVFAGDTTSPKVESGVDSDYASNNTTGNTATFTVTLNVPQSSFYGHYYGFTDSATPPTDDPVIDNGLPTSTGTLALQMNLDDKTVTGDSIYVYWKVRSAFKSKIEVKSTGLVNNDSQASNADHVITLNVKANKEEATSCTLKTPVTVFTKELDGDGADNIGNQELKFTVGTMTGADVGSYTATLTMVISTHA